MSKKIIAYVAVPVAFSVILIGVYLAGGNSLWQMALSEFKLAAVKGAPEYTFENVQTDSELQTEGEIKEGEVNYPLTGTMFAEIVCESAGLKTPLYYGDSKEVLEKGAGLYTGSNLPGQNGTILIGGHDTTFMAPLEKVQKGDKIAVTTTYGKYVYEVTKMKVADVMDQKAYELEKTEEQLVLYTCYPFGKVTSTRTDRYYVYAKKVSGPSIKEGN